MLTEHFHEITNNLVITLYTGASDSLFTSFLNPATKAFAQECQTSCRRQVRKQREVEMTEVKQQADERSRRASLAIL